MGSLKFQRLAIQTIGELKSLVPTFVLAIILSGKLDDRIDFLKDHPIHSIVGIFAVYLFLLFIHKYLKKQYDIRVEDTRTTELEALNSDLQQEITFYKNMICAFKQQISGDLEDKLYDVYKTLGFGNTHRITVYTYTNNVFFSIGRYSANPSFSKFGRIKISDEKEMLFQMWKSGEEKVKTIGQDVERNMKSKKIGIFFLYAKNDNKPNKDKFGVIVFESINKKDKILCDSNIDKLREVTEEVNSYFYERWNIRQDLDIAIKEDL
ncbi:hypothetical protein Hc94105_1698 [Helicobacter cinaedi]|uniref:hypothetical protein n=1 Tax=Helicobacter cinaedi TaxID=213 RepID=UPI001F465120|nr:hypothetical protein [Helicobacter cinaedi]BDB67475.1 hypothetical protein Hc94105_1698 [Helicobacter cinaedi]